jgi:hypothetical protein
VIRRTLVLVICSLSMRMVGLDLTIANVAVPTIPHDLYANLPELQWIVDAYASLLMPSGSMSDCSNRGLVLFRSRSMLCSMAH